MTRTRARVLGNIDATVVECAAELVPLLAEHAVVGEREGWVQPAVVDAMRDAGLFRIVLPKRAGGLAATMATQIAVAETLAQGCPSAAWVQSLYNINGWAASKLGPEGRAEIFETGVAPLICGVLTPSGNIAKRGADYVLNGSWGFASGSPGADWAIVGVEDRDQTMGNQAVAVVPMNAVDLKMTWNVAGMCATGSNTIVAEDVIVPAHRVLNAASVLEALGSYELEACDHWPMGMALTSVITGPVIGAVEAIYSDVADNARTRGISYTTYEHQIDSSVVLRSLAEASLQIDTARHHLFGVAASVDAAADAAAQPSGAEAGYARGACGHAMQVLRTTADRLVSIGGASCFASSNRVQKLWRDTNVGSRHAFVATDPSLEVMGRAAFGLDQIMPIV